MFPARVAALLVVSAAVALSAPPASPAPAGAATLSGVVLSADRTQRTLYLADSAGRVYLVLAKRVFPLGSRVSVSGTIQPDGWTMFATGRSDRLARTGSVNRVTVRGQLGFVDTALHRFQLGAHGQLVAEVRFAPALGATLVRQSARSPNRTRVFQLTVTNGALVLVSLPR